MQDRPKFKKGDQVIAEDGTRGQIDAQSKDAKGVFVYLVRPWVTTEANPEKKKPGKRRTFEEHQLKKDQ